MIARLTAVNRLRIPFSEGSLVGGGHGVALGRVFFTESQFSLKPNTSKLGFCGLNWHLARWGYRLNDGKWTTPTIVDMGFHMVPREDFLELVAASVGQGGRPGRWTVEASPEVVAGDDWDIRNGVATSGDIRAKRGFSC